MMDKIFTTTLDELRHKANDARAELQRKRREQILEMSHGFPVTNNIVQSQFGVSRQTASKDLALLVKTGVLSRIGHGRNTTYVRA